jgi:pyruvate,water dikinase
MGSERPFVIVLGGAGTAVAAAVGGKGANLARLKQAGLRVPGGFCITIAAYERFVKEARLTERIRMELGRKPLESMRWEELWDAALRIRSAFLAAPVPSSVAAAIRKAVRGLVGMRPAPLAVRSSAPAEDSSSGSFAGLHESVLGVVGVEAVLDAVRIVWASLWSDAAILYRRELKLDPARSGMAVVVQEMAAGDPSGVAFGRDPRDTGAERSVIEAVPGRCDALVDGLLEPDQWILDRFSGEVIEWRPGRRDGETGEAGPLLLDSEVTALTRTLRRVEDLFGWAPDVEWTGRADQLVLLQARPITTLTRAEDEERRWYLSLRPGDRKLRELCDRVANDLIPRLRSTGDRFAAEPIEDYGDDRLAAAIEERLEALQRWRTVYRDDFIPFAHGIRRLGTYYNDAVHPGDPYEFLALMRGEEMLAVKRNRRLRDLARRACESPELMEALAAIAGAGPEERGAMERNGRERTRDLAGAAGFWEDFEVLRRDFMNVAYGDERLEDRPDLLAGTIVELAGSDAVPDDGGEDRQAGDPSAAAAEQRLLAAVGPDRQEEAKEFIRVGRLSWRLRDDDNLLMGRLESQLLRALNIAADRLRSSARLNAGGRTGEASADAVVRGLRNPEERIVLPEEPPPRPVEDRRSDPDVTPRQLIGQPAAPGVGVGPARIIRGAADLGRFRAGEVLVCDAIQPAMTHLVPLAAAVVERRGGMLIHGAIIARELGIPCVNGVQRAADQLQDGMLLTVDGNLGIVTVGEPEFDLELRIRKS